MFQFVLLVALTLPTLPPDAESIGTRLGMCSEGGVWMTSYNTAGDPTDPEIITVGRSGTPEPMVWFFYKVDSSEAEHIYITISGKPVEEVTVEELNRRFPGPCDLPYLAGA